MAANASKEKAADSATCVPEQFPVGLKVLVVDDDVICLRILEQMLRKCLYSVTTCSQATAALSLLRERKGFFDIVLSDVHMPDMDGFKLLEFVGLEMDLPVIMMSGDDRTSNVMRGIRHGACDYLIKPIRTEELQNIWQHVVRKKRNVSKGQEGNLESDDDQRKCGHGNDDDDEDGSSVNEGSADGAIAKNRRKRKDIKEEDGNLENDDHTMSKKQRVVWSVELHQQFVSAVNQLGIDKAVPKRILEVMNVPGLSRENVASHLQKFRLYLKRLSGVSNQQYGLSNRLGGPLDQNPKLGSFNSLDYQALVSSGRISPEILAALHTEFLNSPTGIPVLPSVDQSTGLQPSLMPKNALLCQNNPYGQPFTKIPYNISRHISSAVDLADSVALSGFGSGSSRDIVNNMAGYAVEQPGNTITRLMQYQHQGEQIIGNNRVMSLMDQDQQRYPEEHRQNLPEHNHYVISANQYGVFSQHSNNPPFTILDPEVSNCAFGGSSSSSSYYSGFVNANNNNDVTLAAAQNMIGTTNNGGPFSTVGYNNTIVCGSYDATSTSTSSKLVDNGLLPNNTTRVFGSGTIIPNRFAVDDTHPPPIMGNANQGRIW